MPKQATLESAALAKASGQSPETAMEVTKTVAGLRAVVAAWRAAGDRVAVVPTMGALHPGHLKLMERAGQICDRVVTTIFVNPKQFNRQDDLDSYPRDVESDTVKLQQVGVDLLYLPAVDEIYPVGFATRVSVTGLSDCLCGAHRPGHFDGVSTVVTKLLLQVLPDVALFGEKDFQQLQIIRRLVRDLDLQVRIAAVETVREADGLALSSRNLNLSAENRRRAPALYRVLTEISKCVATGAAIPETLAWGRARLTEEGFIAIDYLEIRDPESLELCSTVVGRQARLFVAAWLDDVRLIDNLDVNSAL